MNDKPESLAEIQLEPDEDSKPRLRSRFLVLLKIGFALACVGGLIVGFLALVESAREAARRSQCVCNMCTIRLALHNYNSTYGYFPPAFVADANGKPMHSWRVLILPFMENQELANEYRLDEPWDGPNNRLLLDRMPNCFSCPSRKKIDSNKPETRTSYVAITGVDAMFPYAESRKLEDVVDAHSDTLMIAEVSSVNIPWTAPRDLDIRFMSFRVNDKTSRLPDISSKHPKGANAGRADGGYSFLKNSIAPEAMRALITINGGEDMDIAKANSEGQQP